MPRKQRSNSITAAVDAALAVLEPPPECPKHLRLRERDIPFWDSILRARARSEWTPDQLVIAAQLARCQADIEENAELLDAEGSVIEKAGRNSTIPFANPRVQILEQMARRQIYLMRAMGMIMVAGNGAAKRTAQSKRSLEGQAAELKQELEDESLLA
jgi:hypothetical protein